MSNYNLFFCCQHYKLISRCIVVVKNELFIFVALSFVHSKGDSLMGGFYTVSSAFMEERSFTACNKIKENITEEAVRM